MHCINSKYRFLDTRNQLGPFPEPSEQCLCSFRPRPCLTIEIIGQNNEISYNIKGRHAYTGGGGSNPIFPQDTLKFGFVDEQKWGKKYMEREGNKLSIFKIEKIPIFPMMRRNLDLGMEKV